MSPPVGDNVIVFKSVCESDNLEEDAYYEAFRSVGYNVTLIPVLDFEFINLNQLLRMIKASNKYSGIIFSSPRCVKGVKLCIQNEDGSILEKWKNSKNYVVGEKTGKLAEDLGLVVLGKEAGNGDDLADIISKGTHTKPFLYPIGSLTQKKFQEKLKQNGITVEEILIYNTKQHPLLEENILKSNYFGKRVYIIYFSPSGVTFTLPLLRKMELDFNNLKFVAIGPTTETAIKNNGLQVAATSAVPNPENLLSAVQNIEREN
ncbi:hypothetical protein RUM44_001734 [Polyplax serrata]|uniref:Tetrapyrrole biosynthesis uroporphyrinogen III synthase domain-containing protein n=1 Tax=Polyplax serrata TaxID=468196 RepID=A0ABR1AKW4_POLSC